MSVLGRQVSLAIVGLTLTSCTWIKSKMSFFNKTLKPEEVVEEYLNVSLNMNDLSQKEKLLNLTTGNLYEAIKLAPAETMKAAFIDKNYKLERYVVTGQRDRTPRETEVSFLIEFVSLGSSDEPKPESAPRTRTENTVVLKKEKGRWLMSDVIGKKTAIDFQIEEAIAPGQKEGQGPRVADEDEEGVENIRDEAQATPAKP